MTEFTYAGHAQDIRFAAGAVRDLGDVPAQYGWNKVLLVSSPSHRRNGNIKHAEVALGPRMSATFETVQPHVQSEQVEEVTDLAQSSEADAIVALGGGSAIGMAKAVSDRLQEIRTGTLAREAHPLQPVVVPTVVIPTTYAGSEMTSVYGVTGPVDGVRKKVTVSGRNIVPRVVLYDPELTADMPWHLTGTSAMNALAHCFEALYSPKRDPLSTSAGLRGIRAIGLALPSVYENGQDIAARAGLLEGAFLAGSALAQVQMAIHHGVCHVLGGSAGVPHGVANSIVLPHALRFNREVARHELAEAAVTIDLATPSQDPQKSADRVIEWVDQLGESLELPRRLSEYGVNSDQISDLAQIAIQGGPVLANPRPVRDSEEMEAFLREML